LLIEIIAFAISLGGKDLERKCLGHEAQPLTAFF